MNKLLSILTAILSPFILLALNDGGTLRYEKNAGQWDKDVLYQSSFLQGKVFVLKDRLSLVILDSNNAAFHKHDTIRRNNESIRYSVFSICPYMGSMSDLVATDTLKGYTNYFLGNDKSKWASKVPSFATVTYRNVYKDIDWEVTSGSKMPKHSYIIHPGGNINHIKTLYRGVTNISVRDNRLIIQTKTDIIEEDELLVYQKTPNGPVKVSAYYVIDSIDEGILVSYDIKEYDKDKDLIIDPSIVFSTYSGSYSDNWGMTSCFDKNLLMISGGCVGGDKYTSKEGSYDVEYHGNWDCVITKYDSLGKNMIFSTYLGGLYGELPHSMIVNNNNEIVIFGTTGSDDFPLSDNAYQTTFNGGSATTYDNAFKFPSGIDMFVTTLSADGSSLVSSTFIGGSGNDGLNFHSMYSDDETVLKYGNDSLYYNYGDGARGEITVDNNNNVYIASCTFSSDFPTTSNAYSTKNNGNQEAVVFKLNRELSTLIFSTYIGGSKDDAAYSLDLDSMNNIYVCGGTNSSDFPTFSSAYNNYYNGGSADAFVCLLSSDGSIIKGSTFYGSNKYDQAFFVRVDNDNYPHIYGQTKAFGSTLIYNAQYNKPNSGQFIAKLTPELDKLVFSTVFGTGDGSINISPSCFEIDKCGRIYCAGWGREFKYDQHTNPYKYGTMGMDITSDALQNETDGADFYIMSIDQDASVLNYGTFFGELSSNIHYGNDHVDGGTSRFDKFGNFYLTECASCNKSQNYPTTEGAFSSTNNSTNCNMASTKLAIHSNFAVADFDCGNINCLDETIEFNNYSRGTSFEWDFGDGTYDANNSEKQPKHNYKKSGVYNVRLISNLEDGCHVSDTTYKTILVLGNSSWNADTVFTCPESKVSLGFNNLSLTDAQNVTFSWSPCEYLSDCSSPNPYASVTTPTMFTLIVKKDNCFDTVYQFVDIATLSGNYPDTLKYCYVPYKYSVQSNNFKSVECSFSKDFSFILPETDDSISITSTEDKYLYIRMQNEGCIGFDSIMLNFSGPEVDFDIKNAGCLGDNNGSININCYYDKPVHYKWSVTNEDINHIESLAPGDYTVNIYSDDGCKLERTLTISETKNMSVAIAPHDASCTAVCNGYAESSVIDGSAPFEYAWSNGKTEQSIYGLCPGEYSITVTDNNGCKKSASTVLSEIYTFDDFSAWTDRYFAYDGQSINLFATYYDNFTYSWQPSANITNPDNYETSATVYESTVFKVTAKDTSGCYKSDTVSVEVVYVDCARPNIFIPNAFTPNNDGINDFIQVSGTLLESIELSIYNRWGERVYHSTDLEDKWDGKYNGNDCSAGVYFYKLEVHCMGGKTFVEGGDITLIR